MTLLRTFQQRRPIQFPSLENPSGKRYGLALDLVKKSTNKILLYTVLIMICFGVTTRIFMLESGLFSEFAPLQKLIFVGFVSSGFNFDC